MARCVCVGAWGGRDKATSVSDTNMAQSQHQYYVYAPSFSASHRVTDPPHPPATRPAPIPSPVQVCPQPALSLSELLFWLKKAVVWPDGAVFSSGSTLSGSVGRGFAGSFLSGFKRARVGGGGPSAGVAQGLLRPSEL